jgi:hypothetical protein
LRYAILQIGNASRGEAMKRAKLQTVRPERMVVLLCLAGAAMLVAGCQPPQGSGFLRKEFLSFRKVAILPFEGDPMGEISRSFTSSFKNRFPEMDVYDQYRLLEIFKKEDLYPNQLSQGTRLKIGETLGAQAVIVGSVFSTSVTSWYLQVKVINTQTGETMGTSYVEMQSMMGPEGMVQACNRAVQQLTPMQ